jgi:hypothetical protein
MFEEGDFLLCISMELVWSWSSAIKQGKVYTYHRKLNSPSDCIEVKEDLGTGYYPHRFIKIDLTELDKIIYGVE